MSGGYFTELDTFVSGLAARYRSNGPPTLCYVTLTMLGYSAFFQGDIDRAELLFGEAAAVDVPERTISVNKPIEARAAFRRGDRARAFEILLGHVDELLDTDHPELAANAAIEFINMMAAAGPAHRCRTRPALPRDDQCLRRSRRPDPGRRCRRTDRRRRGQPAGAVPRKTRRPPCTDPHAQCPRRTGQRFADPLADRHSSEPVSCRQAFVRCQGEGWSSRPHLSRRRTP